MKHYVRYSVLCATLLVAGQMVTSAAEDKAPPSRAESVLVTVTATVEDIDYNSREVTLKGQMGNEVTFVVDPAVKRFNEIKVGDVVQADYYVAVAAELRKPTAEEREHPIQVLDAAGKAPPGVSPAAGGLHRFKVVTTVEGIDRPTQSITVKGPRGHYFTTRVADPSRLTKVRIGDNIVVTYTEAVAISLEKPQKKTSE
jgi:hypothetical protein